MYYVVAEEEPKEEGNGNIIIVSSSWLTPRKIESFWPNAKFSHQFNKILQKHEEPNENWSLIKIKRKFFETDDLILARRKAKEAESISDVTDGETSQKRKRRPRQVSSSEDEDPFQHDRLAKKKQNIFTNTEYEKLECESIASGTEARNKTPSVNDITESTENTPFRPISISSTPTRSDVIKLTSISNTPTTSDVIKPTSISNTPTTSDVTKPTRKSGYEYNTMKILNTILEQNNQILTWIRTQNDAEVAKTRKTPIQLPINLPLTDEDELYQIEQFLEVDKNFTDLCEYFGVFAGHTVTGTVNKILKHTMSNKLAMKFSYRGKKGKQPFEALNLKTAIIRAIKKIFKLQAEKQIEDDIKVWLKHAPQRAKLEEKKILSRLNRTV